MLKEEIEELKSNLKVEQEEIKALKEKATTIHQVAKESARAEYVKLEGHITR